MNETNGLFGLVEALVALVLVVGVCFGLLFLTVFLGRKFR